MSRAVRPSHAGHVGYSRSTRHRSGAPEPIKVLEPTFTLSNQNGRNVARGGLAFDPTGERLLVSYLSGRSQLWDVATWTTVDDESFETRDIVRADWSRDGRLVATTAFDGTISIRDGATFEEQTVLVGAEAGLAGLAFSPDNTLLLTNREALLWDLETGTQVGIGFGGSVVDGDESTLPGGSFTADQEELRLVTAADQAALIWNLDTESWADIACRVAGSNLTAHEWNQWGPRDTEPYAICPDQPLR